MKTLAHKPSTNALYLIDEALTALILFCATYGLLSLLAGGAL